MTANLTYTVEKPGLVEYDEALGLQRQAVEDCRSDAQARLFLLEHPHTYTLGARGDTGHLLADEERLRLLGATLQRTDRGGDITYHGPGQLVGYPIVNLKRWQEGPRWYVRSLEQVLIETLAEFGIEGRRVDGRPGVWAGESKIAAIGVRVSRGITSHGFALNVDPDLEYFSHIVPCGLAGVTVTSMAQELEEAPRMDDVMDTVSCVFGRVFDLRMPSLEREEAVVG